MVEKTIDTKLAHALGVARSNYQNLKDQKVADEVIKAVQTADAKKWKLTIDEWIKLINSRPVSRQSAQVTEKREAYRKLIDQLTDNYLSCSNEVKAIKTPEEALKFCKKFAKSVEELVTAMGSYRAFVPVNQSERQDWRVLLSVSTLLGHPELLARYRGGWGDGSPVDRNQYSNGRLVPHAKSTGYKLEQEAPTFHDLTPKKQEQPKQPKK